MNWAKAEKCFISSQKQQSVTEGKKTVDQMTVAFIQLAFVCFSAETMSAFDWKIIEVKHALFTFTAELSTWSAHVSITKNCFVCNPDLLTCMRLLSVTHSPNSIYSHKYKTIICFPMPFVSQQLQVYINWTQIITKTLCTHAFAESRSIE